MRAGPPGQIPPITLPEGSDVNAPEGYGIALSIVPTDYCNWRFNPDGSRVVDVTIRNTGFAGYGSGSTLYLTSVGRPPRTTSRPIPPVDAGASITIPIATPTQVLEPTFEIRIDNQEEARRTCLE